jgi:hypothetical protein
MTNSADHATSVTAERGWQAVGRRDPRSLSKARELVLNMVQWPARIANSYVTGATWQERTRLQWRGADDSIATASFDDGFGLKLRPQTLEMCFLEHGKPVPHTFNPEERSPAEAEAWILVELLHRGIDRTRFTMALPYSIPDLLTGDAEDYPLHECAAELAELAAWYHNAALSFATIAKEHGTADPSIDYDPQNLTMTCVLKSSGGGAPGAAIELGFSSGQGTNDEPCLWAAPVNAGQSPRGARRVMRASAIAAIGEPQASVATFLRSAVADIGG